VWSSSLDYPPEVIHLWETLWMLWITQTLARKPQSYPQTVWKAVANYSGVIPQAP